jgi:hypothetical protein
MVEEPPREPAREERFTEEELKVVQTAGLFDMYLGRGWFRSFIIYGVPAVSALLIAAGIFSSLVEVSETLILYSQPTWIPGSATGMRVAVMDREGDFVPVTDLEMTLRDPEGGRTAVLYSGEAHGTLAASLYVVPPDWPAGDYDLEVLARTTRRAKRATLRVHLDPEYGGEAPLMTRNLSDWRKQYAGADFMDPGSDVHVDLVPEGGQVASSLPNILYVRTTAADGSPVAASVGLALAEGYISGELPGSIETDALGLASLIVYPTFNVLVMGIAAVPSEPPEAVTGEPVVPSTGRVILPIGPQGIRLRPLVPNPRIGEAVRLRVYSVGIDRVIFTDLYHRGVWVKAGGTTVDGQSSEIEAPVTRVPGLHVVQAYTTPVPVILQNAPDRPPELLSCSMSAAHIWVRQGEESDLDSLEGVAAELVRLGVDARYAGSLTRERLEAGGFNPGQAIAFLLARLDGAVYPPGVSASSRADDKRTARSLQLRMRNLVVVAFVVMSVLVLLAAGFLAYETWRASRRRAAEPGIELPLASQDPAWLKKQIFQICMITAVVMGTFGLLAVLVAYLRWQIF